MSQCFTGVLPATMLCRLSRTRRNSRFGENVRKFREQQGWSQEQLAERLKAKQPDVSGWENGGVPSLSKVVKLALVLGCSVDDLVAGVDRDYDVLHFSGHGTHTAGAISPDGTTETAARLLDLERRVKDYEVTLREVEDIASRLAKIAIRGREGASSARAPTGRRGRHREAS